MFGILAYGSLIDDPGKELRKNIKTSISEVKTPFPIEFARSSNSRDKAPTLIPYKKGSKVLAKIFVIREGISKSELMNVLWRRETNNIGSQKTYCRPINPTKNSVLIDSINNWHKLEFVFYTRIGNNIDNITAKKLAKLAIYSAKSKAGKESRDGISYLISAKKNGINTPLSEDYENEILKLTGQDNLIKAHQSIIKD